MAKNTLEVLNEAFVPDERKQAIRGKRLKRLRGQVDGLERMLDKNRPCVEILTQVAAAQQALRGVGKLDRRIRWCGTTWSDARFQPSRVVTKKKCSMSS